MKDKLVSSRLVRYLLAGGVSYAIELACLLTLHRLAHTSAEISTAIAFWIGLFASFLLQKVFAFRDYQKTVKAITSQVFRYGILVAFNYSFTLLIVGLFPESWLIFSRTLALVITTAWNFVLYKRLVFKDAIWT